ncbi:MAG: LytR C-terminal domain-containing protein [Lachnospiraceae bacterium]|nr:LytR C-terminal domain-containing protein [Lachnospiraceae bacterium]
MKKQSVARIVLKTFFKTMGIMALFIMAGVLSYYLTMLYYNQTTRVERSTQYTHVIPVNAGNESSNLIYSYDEKTKKIKAMVLELFDETTKNLDYITIPANTQITISAGTYAELMKVSQQVPQLASMSDINSYFSGDVAYEYGIMILQEELRADIGYFTALPSKLFDTYFEKKTKKEIYSPSESLLSNVAKCTTEDDMDDFIEDVWDDLISDITLSQKQNYSKALIKVNQDYIRTRKVYGSESGGVFTLNRSKNRKMINNIWESEAYTEPQKKTGGSSGTATSKGRSIQLTNGSGINGLAASYQQKLQADGFNVIGVGNYVGDVQEKTTIYVKKKKWGKDLLKYFKDAAIKVADNLTNGADIEIVLGTQDDLS